MSEILKRKVGCIHAAAFTAQVIQPYVNRYLPEVEFVHAADDSIQNSNLSAPVGTIPKGNYIRFVNLAKSLQDYGVEIIMLACSTFNRAVEYARPMIDVPMLQIDKPMMELAVREGKRIGLIATLPSTVPSSERLLRLAAQEAGKEIEIETILSDEAFKVLRSGNPEKHNEILLEEIDLLSSRVDAIVLAQLSMSALEPMLGSTRVPVYMSADTSMKQLRKMLYNE